MQTVTHRETESFFLLLSMPFHTKVAHSLHLKLKILSKYLYFYSIHFSSSVLGHAVCKSVTLRTWLQISSVCLHLK